MKRREGGREENGLVQAFGLFIVILKLSHTNDGEELLFSFSLQ